MNLEGYQFGYQPGRGRNSPPSPHAKTRGAGWTRTTGLQIMSPLPALRLPAETGAKSPVTSTFALGRIRSFPVVSRALAAPTRPARRALLTILSNLTRDLE